MKKSIELKFPSGSDYRVTDNGAQSVSVNRDRITYSWEYSGQDLRDPDDELLGYEDEKHYKGSSALNHKFFAGFEVSRNTNHNLWNVIIRFSGIESKVILVETEGEARKIASLIQEWDEWNRNNPQA